MDAASDSLQCALLQEQLARVDERTRGKFELLTGRLAHLDMTAEIQWKILRALLKERAQEKELELLTSPDSPLGIHRITNRG